MSKVSHRCDTQQLFLKEILLRILRNWSLQKIPEIGSPVNETQMPFERSGIISCKLDLLKFGYLLSNQLSSTSSFMFSTTDRAIEYQVKLA